MTATRNPLVGAGLMFDNPHASGDSSLTFWTMAQTAALDAATVVDVGCGRGAVVDGWGAGRSLSDLRAAGRTVVGIDVDPDAAANPVVDRFGLIDDGHWPLDDGWADLVVSDWTLEHVQDPEGFVAELDRVLRPGGVFLARTVARRSPMALVSRIVPNRRHAGVLRRLQPVKDVRDTFPACYRMNGREDMARLLGDRYDWSLLHRPGLETYLRPWPVVAGAVDVVEHVLPRSAQLVMVVAARRRH